MKADRAASSLLVPAAQYARQIGVAKSRMSAWFAKGLPFTVAKDGHGRDCKMVDPAKADAWRASSLQVKVDGAGRVRGLVEERAAEREPADAGTSTAERIQASKAQQAEDDAAIRRMALMRAQGSLVDRRAALAAQQSFVMAVAAAIDRMAADQATVVAAAVGCTEHQAYQALKGVAVRMKQDLARYADAAAERSRRGLALAG